jgi:anti-sigma regulatory factor (Ser/Thr protein kinase)
VKAAREWVGRILREIGRPDLVDNAQLGVTELVTNAILHSRPPVTLRVRGTADQPRIEVCDNSILPPQVSPHEAADDDVDLSTVGRGLSLVAMMSARWGTDVDVDDSSKTVWFEPSADMHDVDEATYTWFEEPTEVAAEELDRSSFLSVELLGVPAQLFGELRRHHFELRRELRLLTMSAPESSPLAVAFTEIYDEAERERRQATGIDRLTDAIARSLPSVDLQYDVPPSTPQTMARVRDLLREIYAVFADDHLLALAPPAHLLALQEWYFTEFVRQGAGEKPVRWDGPTADPR